MRQVSILLVVGVALVATQALSGAYLGEAGQRRDGTIIQEGEIAVLDRARDRSERSRELDREQRREERLAARERERGDRDPKRPDRSDESGSPRLTDDEMLLERGDQRAGTGDSSGGTS